ncbi:MAG: glycosyltransferase [Dehalococcoidia bacterium]|nr:glycosyltransferase [Dehalococcoidia bacterium]
MPLGPSNVLTGRPQYLAVLAYHGDSRLASTVGEEFAREQRMIPVPAGDDSLVVVSVFPMDQSTLEDLRRVTARQVREALGTWPEIELALDLIFQPQRAGKTLRQGLLQLLPKAGLLSEEQAADACEASAGARPALDPLVDRGYLDEISLVEATSLLLYLPWVRLENYQSSRRLARLFPAALSRQHRVVPLFLDGPFLFVATPQVLGPQALAELEAVCGLVIKQTLCTMSAFLESTEAADRPSPTSEEESTATWPEALLEGGFVDRRQWQMAEAVHQATSEPIEAILLRLGHLTREKILAARAWELEVELVDLAGTDIPVQIGRLLPEILLRRYRCVPFSQRDKTLSLAMADPLDKDAIDIVSELTKLAVQPYLCTQEGLEAAWGSLSSNRQTPVRVEARRPIVWYLVQGGYVTEFHLHLALERQTRTHERIGQALIALHFTNEEALAEALGLQMGMPWLHLDKFFPAEDAVRSIPEDLARQHCFIPLMKEEGLLTLIVADPLDSEGIAGAQSSSGLVTRIVLATSSAIRANIEHHYSVALSEVNTRVKEFTDHLVQQGAMSDQQRWVVLREHVKTGKPVDLIIADADMLPEEDVSVALAEFSNMDYMDISPYAETSPIFDALGIPTQKRVWVDPVDISAAVLVTPQIANALAALPVGFRGESVLVTFANPLHTSALEEMKAILGRPVTPIVSSRYQIAEAITRTIGKKSIGMYLLEAGVISKKQLDRALLLHQKDGVRIGQALMSLGFLTQESLSGFVAEQLHVPFYDLSGAIVDSEVVRLVPQEIEREHHVVPILKDDQTLTLAMVDPLDESAIRDVEQLTGFKVSPVLTTEDGFNETMEGVYSDEYLQRSTSELLARYPDESAYKVLSSSQKIFGISVLVISAVFATLNHILFFIALNILTTFYYLGSSVYKLYLIYRSLSHSLEIPTTEEELAALDDRELPVYTILVPLYREASVLPGLVKGIAEMDYPKTKLDVKLLLEEDDKETIEAIRAYGLPAHFKVVIVPDAQPKGKPKACNYGLIHAEGKYTVIFDAEDVPEPDQLKKALVAFRKADESVVCVQAKLNYYNRNQNLLTRWFTSEYAQWFDLFLPGLDAADAPIPLGGTSNHFRTHILRQIGGWDPYNVTEDADLGMRLYKLGYKTGVIDSTTYEEANSQLYNWIRQRSRWVKGYMQTYLVQMRHPFRLWRSIGTMAFISFNLVIGGTFISFFLNPIYWMLTALWFLTGWSMIKEIYPSYLYYLGSFSLYVGNFVFVYVNAAGCLKRGYYDLVKYALMVPLYWAIMSIGAWKGLIQLIYKPFYWEKTVHGLYKGGFDTSTATTWHDLVFGQEAPGAKDEPVG